MLLSPVPKRHQPDFPAPFRYRINTPNLGQFLIVCCSPLTVFLTGNPCRRCVVQYWRSRYCKTVLTVYISLDSYLVVSLLSNKTHFFPVYPSCRKSVTKQLFSIMLEICPFVWYSVSMKGNVKRVSHRIYL